MVSSDDYARDEALGKLRELHRTNGEHGWQDGFLMPRVVDSRHARPDMAFMPMVALSALAHAAGYALRVRVCRRTPGMYRVNLDPLPGVQKFRKELERGEELRGD